MDIKVFGHEYFYDITSMSMLFFPGEKVCYVRRSSKPTHIISGLYFSMLKSYGNNAALGNTYRNTSAQCLPPS